jgi:hyaluronoglucosaminidase
MKEKTWKLKKFGIVEGFFSKPLKIWSWEERINIIKFLVKNCPGINVYFYCPKDDPYVTRNWKKLYPLSQLAKIKEFIQMCKENNLDFVFGFNPSLPYKEEKVKDWLKEVEKKIKQLFLIGCRNFCLLFDDIPFAYDVLDHTTQNSEEKIGEDLVTAINILYKTIKKNIEELWVCSPDYCFKKETKFTNQLKNLNPNIPIIWTGNDVFIKSLKPKDLKRVKNILGQNKKIIWWDNYPVNDCEQTLGTLNLGGFNNPSEEVLKNLYGVIVNPMREAYANLPFFFTLSDYIYINKKGKKYNRKKSWRNALRKLLGKNWRSYYFIINNFSAKNKVDDDFKYFKDFFKTSSDKSIFLLLNKVLTNLEIINKDSPPNFWGKLFKDSIEPLFKDAAGFLKIAKKVIAQKRISKNEFLKWNRFPTTISVSRYLPEIFKIAKKRLTLLPKNFYPKERIVKLSKKVKNFQKKYTGAKKLFLSKNESLRINRISREIVNLEANQLLKYLNDPRFRWRKKIILLTKRQNINRFNFK